MQLCYVDSAPCDAESRVLQCAICKKWKTSSLGHVLAYTSIWGEHIYIETRLEANIISFVVGPDILHKSKTHTHWDCRTIFSGCAKLCWGGSALSARCVFSTLCWVNYTNYTSTRFSTCSGSVLCFLVVPFKVTPYDCGKTEYRTEYIRTRWNHVSG